MTLTLRTTPPLPTTTTTRAAKEEEDDDTYYRSSLKVSTPYHPIDNSDDDNTSHNDFDYQSIIDESYQWNRDNGIINALCHADGFESHSPWSLSAAMVGATVSTALALWSNTVNAVAVAADGYISTGSMDPTNFNPVCPASDGFYRFLQGTTQAVVGDDAFVEYGPLIAGGLLRIRLELCVVESFFKEAVGPFIQRNGVSWILPLHESVETFIAGTIFALATTFILIGSTKILSVIFTYGDFLVGTPARILGGFAFDRASGKPVTLDIGFGPFKTRIVGPPDVKSSDNGDSNNSNLAANALDAFKGVSPGSLIILLISGIVRVIGQVVGVCRSCYHVVMMASFCSRFNLILFLFSPQRFSLWLFCLS
jgi:hypothetical protein